MGKLSGIVTEVGLAELMDRPICIYCGVYIYTGRLAGIGPDSVKLAEASIVYETGELQARSWADAQPLPGPHWWVSRAAIESFGPGKD